MGSGARGREAREVAPPSTPGGMAEIAAPTLGHNDNAMATAAATQYAAVQRTGLG